MLLLLFFVAWLAAQAAWEDYCRAVGKGKWEA